jgi:hypothetical protein
MSVGLEEIERHWSICDVWDANIVLDELDAAEAEAYEK